MNLFSGRKPIRGKEQVISNRNREMGPNETENTTQKEDVLLDQINELKKKAESLQRVLAVREQRAEELGQVISDREEKVKELDAAIDSRREAADQLIVGVTVQIQEMIQALDKQMELLDVKAERQLKQIGENSVQQMEQLKSIECLQKQLDENSVQQQKELKTALNELNDKLENVKVEFSDRIHTENVKCYRNIKSLFTDMDGRLAETELGNDSMEKIQKSFKGWKFFSFFAFADFILIIVYILYSMGIF